MWLRSNSDDPKEKGSFKNERIRQGHIIPGDGWGNKRDLSHQQFETFREHPREVHGD